MEVQSVVSIASYCHATHQPSWSGYSRTDTGDVRWRLGFTIVTFHIHLYAWYSRPQTTAMKHVRSAIMLYVFWKYETIVRTLQDGLPPCRLSTRWRYCRQVPLKFHTVTAAFTLYTEQSDTAWILTDSSDKRYNVQLFRAHWSFPWRWRKLLRPHSRVFELVLIRNVSYYVTSV